MKQHNYYVYIMASNSGTLYIGVTNDLERRVYEHKKERIEGFTKKYQCKKLVYYEHYEYIDQAILREKKLKGWKRCKKEELIRTQNSFWSDISSDWERFKEFY